MTFEKAELVLDLARIMANQPDDWAKETLQKAIVLISQQLDEKKFLEAINKIPDLKGRISLTAESGDGPKLTHVAQLLLKGLNNDLLT